MLFKKFIRFIMPWLILGLVFAFTACETVRGPVLPANMPNPAAVYCEEQGGTNDIRKEADGDEYGVCIFADGSECGDWAYYRGECQPGQTEQTADMPNPASMHCEEQGGQVEIHTDDSGGQYGVCVFENGSECDEWAFFRGECQPGQPSQVDTEAVAPTYVNQEFGFSLNPPNSWSIEDKGDYLLFTRPGYKFFLGFQAAGEEPKPFRTGMPAGEFVDSGTALLLGQPLPRQILVFEGKNKVVAYGGRIQAGDLMVVMYLDAVETDEVGYAELDIPQEIIDEGDQIIASFAFTSGKIPVIQYSE